MSFFSIIIPTYNRVDFLAKAINSVINQDFGDYEIIVVDDASTDSTKKYLESLNGLSKLKVVHNEKNLYKGGARNVGVKIATGKYICFLDDDDYYLPMHLSVFYREINVNKEQVSAFFTMPITEYTDGRIERRLLLPIKDEHPVEYFFHHKNGVPTPRLCIHAEILKKDLFNPLIKIGQDTELLLRIASKHPVFAINDHTVVQVRHCENSGDLKYNAGKQRFDGYKYIFDNNDVSKYISPKLRYYMYSYCYLRQCEHYEFTKNKLNVIKCALLALWYSPFDNQLKTKLVFILYNIPFGSWFKCFNKFLLKKNL